MGKASVRSISVNNHGTVIMHTERLLVAFGIAFGSMLLPASAADVSALVPSLRQGGYVLVVRHTATDDSQKDVYPFVFDDMKKQRQLSDEGRRAARDLGAPFKALGIPFGQVYTSKLNRAVETGALVSGRETVSLNALTDSGAGSASAMANPDGTNEKIGSAIRELVNTAPRAGTNILLVTHKTNIADAFGKSFGDVKEGEALVYKPSSSGAPTLIERVQASEWSAHAGVPKL
jgi:phosphohistidine phosphatase SixA